MTRTEALAELDFARELLAADLRNLASAERINSAFLPRYREAVEIGTAEVQRWEQAVGLPMFGDNDPRPRIVAHDGLGNPVYQSELDAALRETTESARIYFGVNEPDYGGALDGSTVTSDAAPGL